MFTPIQSAPTASPRHFPIPETNDAVEHIAMALISIAEQLLAQEQHGRSATDLPEVSGGVITPAQPQETEAKVELLEK